MLSWAHGFPLHPIFIAVAYFCVFSTLLKIGMGKDVEGKKLLSRPRPEFPTPTPCPPRSGND